MVGDLSYFAQPNMPSLTKVLLDTFMVLTWTLASNLYYVLCFLYDQGEMIFCYQGEQIQNSSQQQQYHDHGR